MIQPQSLQQEIIRSLPQQPTIQPQQPQQTQQHNFNPIFNLQNFQSIPQPNEINQDYIEYLRAIKNSLSPNAKIHYDNEIKKIIGQEVYQKYNENSELVAFKDIVGRNYDFSSIVVYSDKDLEDINNSF